MAATALRHFVCEAGGSPGGRGREGGHCRPRPREAWPEPSAAPARPWHSDTSAGRVAAPGPAGQTPRTGPGRVVRAGLLRGPRQPRGISGGRGPCGGHWRHALQDSIGRRPQWVDRGAACPPAGTRPSGPQRAVELPVEAHRMFRREK